MAQLNKNVCYGCYTKNGRLLHVCYNVCYSCYKRVHNAATNFITSASRLIASTQLDLRLNGKSPFGCSARV